MNGISIGRTNIKETGPSGPTIFYKNHRVIDFRASDYGSFVPWERPSRLGLHLSNTNKSVSIPSMYTSQIDILESARTLRLRFFTGDTCISYADFLRALNDEPSFRELLQEEMRAAPFVAFRWEAPPLATTTLGHPFECLFHDSPDLDVTANLTDFEAYFRPDEDVVTFENLGADALLIVPCPISESTNYSHIGAFHRSAPSSQQHAFWVAVSQAARDRMSAQPLWLSTAGGGVDWLHMRLDKRPKYYRHLPWRVE